MSTVADLLPIIERVARDVHFTYGIEKEDAEGILALQVVERLNDYLVLFDEGHIGIIELRLKDVAKMYARKQRVDRQAELGQYYYDPEYVRLFLPFFYAYDDWGNGPKPDDTISEWRTGEAIDTALDLKLAYPNLKPWMRDVINARHFTRPDPDGGVDWDAIAVKLGRSTGAAVRTAYATATRELVVEMNEGRAKRNEMFEGPGAREAISNSSARYLLS